MSNVIRLEPVIRAAVAQDAEQIATLGMQVWLHTYATAGVSREMAQYVLKEFTAAKMTLAIKDTSKLLVVAETPKNIVGYAVTAVGNVCPSRPAMHIELATLYVQEPFKGQGTGSALLGEVEHLVAQRSGTGLWITVNASNYPAIEFYAKRKYTKVGTAYFEPGSKKHENHVLIRQDA